MPWRHLSAWFAERGNPVSGTPMPLTLVTLRGTEPPDHAAMAFHAEAEFEALVLWALAGRFVLALTTLDRAELTLLCTEPVVTLYPHVHALPLMAAGLASADLRPVMSVRLTPPLLAPAH